MVLRGCRLRLRFALARISSRLLLEVLTTSLASSHDWTFPLIQSENTFLCVLAVMCSYSVLEFPDIDFDDELYASPPSGEGNLINFHDPVDPIPFSPCLRDV